MKLPMKKDKLWVLILFLAVLAGVAGFHGVRGLGPDSPTEGRLPVATGGFRGMSLQLHSSWDKHPYEKYITEIRRDAGANTICLVIPGYQENAGSTSIFVDARKVPSDKRLLKLIDHARQEGLRVFLMPIVLLENPREGEWRGKIKPDNWDDWWEDYNNYILHYAEIARKGEITGLIIGSELISTETQTDRWKRLIAAVRKRFDGKLSYSANWDHYRPIKFWRELDLIGMTTYYDLTGGKKPTVERLMEAWRPIKREVLEWQKTIGRPILFTEVGWPNQETCAQYPWDYYRATDRPDPEAQSNCFEAFFRTWIDVRSVAGFLVWEWRNYPQQKTDPQKDTSYVPCGKPCLKVIRRYFHTPVPEAASQPHSRPAETAPG